MGKFKFKLQSILNLKEKMEEQKKIELGKATTYLVGQEAILKKYQISLGDLTQELHGKSGKSVYAKELLQLNHAIKYYEEEIHHQKEIIIKAKEVVEQKREALNKALIEKKTYEKLKEFALEKHLQEEQLLSNKQLDEVISYSQTKEINHL